jgi:hypothetical protein
MIQAWSEWFAMENDHSQMQRSGMGTLLECNVLGYHHEYNCECCLMIARATASEIFLTNTHNQFCTAVHLAD